MIKNDNKGFMLAEVIITSTVIIATLVGLYTGVSRLNKLYEERSKYYDIDGVYAIRSMMNYLFGDNRLNIIFSSEDYSNNIFLIENGTCKFSLDNDNMCNSLRDYYNIQNMMIVDSGKIYNKSDDSVYIENINETLKDYFKYLYNYYYDSTDYSYFVILECGDDNDLKYSSLRLR